MGDDNMQGIYMILNEYNGKCYVGQSIDIETRWENHKIQSRRLNYHLYKSMRKHGLDWFNMYILEEVDNQEDLTAREQFWYDVLKPEFNNVEPRKHTVVHSKAVVMIDVETLEPIAEFESVREACRKTGAYRSNLSKSCKTGHKSNGYYWVYKGEKLTPKTDGRRTRKLPKRDENGKFMKR